ncbi:hypothetical protein HYR99_15215 [Candidatus Poribacteria bacterium]|nr:hypothetical protein [Candidatus Poribacteria bacterium]
MLYHEVDAKEKARQRLAPLEGVTMDIKPIRALVEDDTIAIGVFDNHGIDFLPFRHEVMIK